MTLETRIKQCIAEQLGSYAPTEILLDHTLSDYLGCDSLDRVELTMRLEEEFDIRIDDDAFGKLWTVGEVVRHVAQLQGATA